MESSEPAGESLHFYEVHQHQTKGDPVNSSADYVIRFRFKPPSSSAKTANAQEERKAYENKVLTAYRSLIGRITAASLEYEVRRVDNSRLLLFIQCPHSLLKQRFDQARVQDWISGVSFVAPGDQERATDATTTTATTDDTKPSSVKSTHQPQTDRDAGHMSTATRLRLVYDLITGPTSEGGAGIRPNMDEFVEAIYPLHDKAYNMALIKNWATKWLITQNDLLSIRNHFGEKIAYYFEFLQFYFVWLGIPSIIGVLVYFIDAGFAPTYALFNVGWSLLFVEMWRRREQELATWWSVRNCSKLEKRRPEFRPERMTVDPITDQPVPYYPSWKRWIRRILTVPILGAIGGIFFLVVGFIFACEVVVYEYYQGPFKDIVYYVPLIAYSVAIWYFSDAYTDIARWLNDFENYETEEQHTRHFTYKLFVINFAVGYMFIFYTAWIHIPYNEEIATLLAGVTGWPIKPQTAGVEKLQERVVYYVLTAQVINFFTEVGLPWLMRGATTSAQKVTKKLTKAETAIKHLEADVDARKFIKRCAREDDLPAYDTYEDYAEMITQFGHVVLFSCAWPLSPLLSFINNWVELRSDAYKICVHTRRQVPARVESIGPWINALLFLSWLSSVVNALLIHQFGHSDSSSNAIYRPLAIVIAAEHLYLAALWLLRSILSDIPSWSTTLARRKEHELKRHWLAEMNVQLRRTRSPSMMSHQEQEKLDELVDLGVQEIMDIFKQD